LLSSLMGIILERFWCECAPIVSILILGYIKLEDF